MRSWMSASCFASTRHGPIRSSLISTQRPAWNLSAVSTPICDRAEMYTASFISRQYTRRRLRRGLRLSLSPAPPRKVEVVSANYSRASTQYRRGTKSMCDLAPLSSARPDRTVSQQATMHNPCTAVNLNLRNLLTVEAVTTTLIIHILYFVRSCCIAFTRLRALPIKKSSRQASMKAHLYTFGYLPV